MDGMSAGGNGSPELEQVALRVVLEAKSSEGCRSAPTRSGGSVYSQVDLLNWEGGTDERWRREYGCGCVVRGAEGSFGSRGGGINVILIDLTPEGPSRSECARAVGD